MNIRLPSDQLAKAENLVAIGRYQSLDELVAEGVRLLLSHEELRKEIQKGIDDVNRGDVVDHETVFATLRETVLKSTPAG
jgi:antitoxin ParD1/3/4